MAVRLKAGAPAPKFMLPDQDGNDVSIDDLGLTVMYFYPKDNTPGCTVEAVDFTKLLPKFRKLKCEVIGVSPDSSESHCKFIAKQKLALTLLSDPKREVVKKYGAWQKKQFMGREYWGVVRSTFLIYEHKILWCEYGVRAKGHAEAMLGVVKGLK